MINFITLNTISTDLLNIVRGSTISRSEPISKRQIEEWIHQYRSLLLKQDLDKGKVPNPDYIQEIDYIKLSVIDEGGENNINDSLNAYSYILRTDLQIPNTIDLNFKSGFMYIGTVSGDEIQFVPESRSKWQQYKKYTNNDSLCFLRNNYLYVLNNRPLSYITVRGVFEVPSEVARFINPITEQPYFNIDSKYPIPANMVPVLKEMILKKELGIQVQSYSDTKNDSEHSVSPNVEGNAQKTR
jgi:hypothetical protein